MNYLEALTKSKKEALPPQKIVVQKYTEKCMGGCLTLLNKPGLCTPCVKRGVAIDRCDFCKRRDVLTLCGCCYDCMEEEEKEEGKSCNTCGSDQLTDDGHCIDCLDALYHESGRW